MLHLLLYLFLMLDQLLFYFIFFIQMVSAFLFHRTGAIKRINVLL